MCWAFAIVACIWNLSLIKLESLLIWLLFSDSEFASNQSPTRIHKEYVSSTVVNCTWQVRVYSSTGKHGSLCARFVYLVSEKKDNAFRNRARWYKGMFNFRFRRKLHCDICPSTQKTQEIARNVSSLLCHYLSLILNLFTIKGNKKI